MTSCRHTAPLLSVLRFGEIDERSERHVAHLEFCGTCQSALVDDGALTRQLERVLRARIDGAAPSPGAWLALKHRIAIEPERWHVRLTRWLRVPASGIASAGALASLAIVLTLSGGPAGLDPVVDTRAAEPIQRATLPIRMMPFAAMARVPAEDLAAPAPPDVESAVMRARYARPVKDPEQTVVLAALLEKASPSSTDGLPDGYELVAYVPGSAAE